MNSAKKTHVFRKGTSFLRFLRKRRTFPKGIICFRRKMLIYVNSAKKDARFPRVEFVDFRKIATAPRENQKIDSGVVQEDQSPLVNVGVYV